MRRIYENLITEHFNDYTQMVFLAGPRQVGKSTISLHAEKLSKNFHYFNWDVDKNREMIIAGAEQVGESARLNTLSPDKPIIVFDEIHKFPRWKNFLKGFFDLYKTKALIIVTGSSKLDVFQKGGDSLMGRYFLYRIHPLSVAEYVHKDFKETEIQLPKEIPEKTWQNLLEFGGFPEPLLKAQPKFAQRWRSLRMQQLLREDIRDLSRVQELGQLEILALLLKNYATQRIVYSNLANKIGVSIDSIKRWIKILASFYYCFTIQPWTKNISRSLLKEPKVYLWDWSEIKDIGARTENFIASHLLKAVQFWTDTGLGQYGLYFIRDKDQREVDFIVTKNQKPWFLVEVKHASGVRLSPHLAYFQAQTSAEHAFQVALEIPYTHKNCFETNQPLIVPAKTFLSQLL
jgi:predicted AAA+ superfamily ATPase